MKFILSAANRGVLRKFASPDTLVAFDFDGTLAPIIRNRNLAALRRTTRKLLAGLAVRYPCVVISGRARRDVQRRLKGTGIRNVVGNHGIEPWSASPTLEKAVRGWLPLLRASLSNFGGVEIEDKRFSVAVHYRGATRKQGAYRAIHAAARKLSAARVIGGKQVINVIPAAAPDKGAAFKRQLLHSRCKRAIYVGDDDTDESVFALPCHRHVLAVRVGRSRDSLAGYYIRNQRDIDYFIQQLIGLRRDARPVKSV